MDRILLKITHRNLMACLAQSREEGVSVDEKINILILSLADLCAALADKDE